MILEKLRKLADPEIRQKNVEAWRLRLREMQFAARPGDMPDPVFVIGCSRSGTTVTFETIAASGGFLHFNHELPQFWNGLYGPLNNGWDSEAAEAGHAWSSHRDKALAYYYARLGVGPILEKTCINTLRVPYLDALFPDARYIFIHRDGRDNISSMMDGWRYGRTDGGFGLTRYFGPSPEPVAINGGEFDQWHFFLPPGWRDYNRASLEAVCAFQWVSANRLALDGLAQIPPRQWLRVRYEDIFDQPQTFFEQIFDFLDIPYDEAARQRVAEKLARPTSVVRGAPARQKWRQNNPEAIRRILPTIEPMMWELGYDPHD